MDCSFTFKNPIGFIFQTGETSPNSSCLITETSKYSYKKMTESILKKAGLFRSHGVTKGMRIAIFSDDSAQVTISIFAIWVLGAVCMPINISQPKEKIASICKIVRPDIGFLDKDFQLDTTSFKIANLSGDAKPINNPQLSPIADDIAIVMFTSGTSGTPKAVPMTYRSIGHNCWETAKKLSITNKDRIFINSPPYYTSSIIHNLTLFSQGGSVAVARSILFGDAIIDNLNKYHCTGFGGVPVHFARLAGALEENKLPKNVRFLMNSGEHLPKPLLLSLNNLLPEIDFYCVYGLTEVSGRLCILDPRMIKVKAGSVGKPLPGMRISIRDAKGNLLPKNTLGEVHVQGIGLMKEYLNNPDANNKSLHPYGFSTGDYGRIDREGYLYLEGRNDDIIKVGGEKVSLKMIEDAIYGFPGIEDLLVASKFSELMGNVPCLYYIPMKGVEFKKKLLINELKKKLPSNHIPSFFVEVESIQRSTSGKKLRAKLSDV